MNIPSVVKQYLARSGGRFRVRAAAASADLVGTAAAAQIPPGRLARTVLLAAGSARLAAVIPADARLDLGRLRGLLGRPVEESLPSAMPRQPEGVDEAALPPLPALFGVKAILDPSLEAHDEVYLPTGSPGVFVRATRDDFLKLLNHPVRGRAIITAPAAEEPAQGLRAQVEDLAELPPMPGIATELLRLRNNPYSHASELASVIQQDPALTAQVIRYAGSPFYGFQGKIDSVETAIVRVLGMDFVMDLAFGLALGKPFRAPKEGPIGLAAFWEHAVHCAGLTQALCNGIDYARRPSPGMAYLAGLLHNVGFLVLAHLFPDAFARLNRALTDHPERSVEEVERETLGMSHSELGMWLMDAWDMPREVSEAVKAHHDAEYDGEFAVYPNLVYVANALLKRHGLGDSAAVEIPDALREKVGLEPEELEIALGTVLEGRPDLSAMARHMAA